MNIKNTQSVNIFSLTDTGRVLAEQLLSIINNAIHVHKPDNFRQTVQQAFLNKHPCIFICATGIVVRTLAPVLNDKKTDPPVLVLDERAEFVIPLLSGHEGGANEWASTIADKLKSQLVITSANGYTRPVYTVGVGCDKGCPKALILELIQHAKESYNDSINFSILASIDIKKNELGIVLSSAQLKLPFKQYSATELRQVEEQLSLKSEIVFREVGCYGVAEAAALIAATELTNHPAELVVTKLKNKRATVAIAKSYF